MNIPKMRVSLAAVRAITIAAATAVGAAALYLYSTPATGIAIAQPLSRASIQRAATGWLDASRGIVSVRYQSRPMLEPCPWDWGHRSEDLAGLAGDGAQTARSSALAHPISMPITPPSEKGIECPINRFEQS